MKLAEALLERKNLMTKIKELHGKFARAAVHDEDSTPEDDVHEIMQQLRAAFVRYNDLIIAINKTNNVVQVNGHSMMEAIARRDVLKWMFDHYNGMAEAIRERNNGMSWRNEKVPKKVIAAGLSIKDVVSVADEAAAKMRKLDGDIQAANWGNDLVS